MRVLPVPAETKKKEQVDVYTVIVMVPEREHGGKKFLWQKR